MRPNASTLLAAYPDCPLAVADPCPLKRTGMAYRCTRRELNEAGIAFTEAVR